MKPEGQSPVPLTFPNPKTNRLQSKMQIIQLTLLVAVALDPSTTGTFVT